MGAIEKLLLIFQTRFFWVELFMIIFYNSHQTGSSNFFLTLFQYTGTWTLFKIVFNKEIFLSENSRGIFTQLSFIGIFF